MPRYYATVVRPSSQSGFTAVELMVAVVILAIVAAIGLPSLLSFIQQSRVDAAADDLAQSMRYARSEAVTRNSDVSVVNAGSNYSDGWSVVVGGVTLREHEALPDGVTTNFGNNIAFNGRGMASASGSITLSYEGFTRCINFTLSGSVTQPDC